jgi:hypothetical protein
MVFITISHADFFAKVCTSVYSLNLRKKAEELTKITNLLSKQAATKVQITSKQPKTTPLQNNMVSHNLF